MALAMPPFGKNFSGHVGTVTGTDMPNFKSLAVVSRAISSIQRPKNLDVM